MSSACGSVGPSAAPSTVAALAEVDAANAEDPNLIDDPFSGVERRPKELVHAERMTHWLALLCVVADDAQQLAARAHHFRRWTSPRDAFPEGRAGYLRWRVAARARHAEEVEAVLQRCGVPSDVREDTATIITKQHVRTDPRVQTHEDALCLVFFELQGLSTAALLGDRTGAVVTKTLGKMSEAGRACLLEAQLPPAVRALVADTLEP